MKTSHAIAALLLLSLSGCYTLARAYQDVEVTSDPPGARVSFGVAEGVTPCVLHVPRSSKPRMVRFELEDHEPLQQEVTVTDDEGGVHVLLAILDGLLILPGLIDLIAWDPFFDWPVAMRATLAPAGSPSSLWIDREATSAAPPTAAVPRRMR